MKIISIRWNDEVAEIDFLRLRRADKDGLFDIAQFGVDTFTDALNYIKDETDANREDK